MSTARKQWSEPLNSCGGVTSNSTLALNFPFNTLERFTAKQMPHITNEIDEIRRVEKKSNVINSESRTFLPICYDV